MTYIIVREGPFKYLKSKDPISCYSTRQSEAMRFDTLAAATKALGWEACYASSWDTRIVRLVPKRPTIEQVAIDLRDQCRAKYAEAVEYAKSDPDFDPGDTRVCIKGRRYSVTTVQDILEAIGIPR